MERTRHSLFFVGALIAAIPSSALAETWRCDATRAVTCADGACNPGNPTIWLLVDFDAATYSRCDDKGCDLYPLNAMVSGVFINASYNPGAFFKALQDASQFIEVVTQQLQTITYFGACRIQQ